MSIKVFLPTIFLIYCTVNGQSQQNHSGSGDNVGRDKVTIYNTIQRITKVPIDQFDLFLGFQLSNLKFDNTQSKKMQEKYTTLNKLCTQSVRNNSFYLKNRKNIRNLLSEILNLQQETFKESFVSKVQDDYDAIKDKQDKEHFKAFLINLKIIIASSDTVYKAYIKTNRSCSLITKLYAKNEEVLSLIKQNEILVKKINLISLDQLVEYLKFWDSKYEQQFKDRYSLQKTSCVVTYDESKEPSYPINVSLKIDGVINSLK